MDSYGFSVKLVKKAGELLLKRSREVFEVGTKNNDPKDIVTTVDFEINNFLINAIKEKFPEHSIYSEEGGGKEKKKKFLWIIDPIDGSANFSRGIPHFSICLAFLKDGIPEAGAVYNPVTKELFSFKKGSGAFLNGKPITVSKTTDLREASVFLHAGRKPELWEWGGISYTKLLGAVKKTSNYGGSALDACFVAAGRIEANIYGQLTTMDIAGAIGILLEAGGRIVNGNGESVVLSTTPQKVIMSNNESIEKALLKIL